MSRTAPLIVTDYRKLIRVRRTSLERTYTVAVVLLAFGLPLVLQLDVTPPLGLPWGGWMPAINFALIGAIGAAAFNLLVGYTHQISLAHAALLITGTITGAYLGTELGMNFLLVLALSLVAGAAVGAVVALPAIRLQGLYLLVATLGIHYVFVLLLKKYQSAFTGFGSLRFNTPTLPRWMSSLPLLDDGDSAGFAIRGDFRWYWVILATAAVSIAFMRNLVRSREGHALMAIGQHEVAAALIGINAARSKLIVFMISSAFVSMSGALGAYYIGTRGENSFTLELVLYYAIMIVIGGFGSIQGAVFGAFLFYLAPIALEWLRSELPGVRSVSVVQDYGPEIDIGLFGLMIIVVLRLRPAGLAGAWQGVKRSVGSWPL